MNPSRKDDRSSGSRLGHVTHIKHNLKVALPLDLVGAWSYTFPPPFFFFSSHLGLGFLLLVPERLLILVKMLSKLQKEPGGTVSTFFFFF